MLEVDFSEEIKSLKHFTQINDRTWLIQRNKESMCESYYVTILENAIVMYGDYGGVIVKPHECKKESLINWMANATTLGYFCEKVNNGNQNHQYKEYSSKIAKDSALTLIRDKFDLSENVLKIISNADEYMLSFDNIRDELISRIALDKGCHPDNVESDFEEDFETFENIVSEFLSSSFEQDRDFFDFCHRNNFYDWCEYDFEDYTFRIKHQHQCLLWWARYVLSQNNKKEGRHSSH
jgi:hypothetical protein